MLRRRFKKTKTDLDHGNLKYQIYKILTYQQLQEQYLMRKEPKDEYYKKDDFVHKKYIC